MLLARLGFWACLRSGGLAAWLATYGTVKNLAQRGVWPAALMVVRLKGCLTVPSECRRVGGSYDGWGGAGGRGGVGTRSGSRRTWNGRGGAGGAPRREDGSGQAGVVVGGGGSGGEVRWGWGLTMCPGKKGEPLRSVGCLLKGRRTVRGHHRQGTTARAPQ